VAEPCDLQLIPTEGGFYGDPMIPEEGLPASGYAVADQTGRKLSWEEKARLGLLGFALDLDTPWDERLEDHRFDPGQIVTLVPDRSARPIPQIRVWDSSGTWRIGYLGVSAYVAAHELLRQSHKSDAFAGIVLLEGVRNGKRVHETILVGPPETISALYRSLGQ
jgi:hypothetical protein